ncbi:hypothetical protein BDQ17DRAFT_277403 [Cyathus striatus]|nr:hypothetical protein BDQ17DRAFT_277403 [Cyathus striatus]
MTGTAFGKHSLHSIHISMSHLVLHSIPHHPSYEKMFNAATNFVIQNGVFIEMRDNAKLYAKKLLTPVKDTQLANYRRIRKGDIHLQEQIWSIENYGTIANVWDEYVVEVSRESKSKVARIYRERDAYALFKKELEVLSKLWHPRIRQIFGVYESNNVFGFIYHDDGMRRRYGDYVPYLNTLQRAAFSIKYTLDYVVRKPHSNLANDYSMHFLSGYDFLLRTTN